MMRELVKVLRFINEYRELENFKKGYLKEAFVGTVVGASGAGVLSIMSFLVI